MKNTPKPPLDIAEIFPFLSGRKKTTTRLHPRSDKNTTINQSKLGGDFLWPSDEPWPVCEESQDAFVGILQLKAQDFPEIEYPPDTDLFQLLWYPNDFVYDYLVIWRKEAEITHPLTKIPQSTQGNRDLVPSACCVYPEKVVEYPSLEELMTDEDLNLEDMFDWDEENNEQYTYLLSTAKGCKVGGYPDWIQQAETPVCECGKPMKHLLTIASNEFDSGSAPRWCPLEDRKVWQVAVEATKSIPLNHDDLCREAREQAIATGKKASQVQVPTGLTLGDMGSFYLFICHQCEEGIVESVFQCG